MPIGCTDALVIGSGFGAAAPALRLAQAGLRVIVIEKGPRLDPLADLRQTNDPQYILHYLKSTGGRHIGFMHAEGLGGGSVFYESISLRAPKCVFEQRDREGRRLWPAVLDRQRLDPYYERAEATLHVAQIASDQVPRTGLVFSRLMKNLGYSCDRARYAVQGCRGCGYCVSGCVYGAKQSLLLNYLPQAVAAGAMVETDLEATEIEALPPSRDGTQHLASRPPDLLPPFRYQVTCRQRADGIMRRFQARVVVLAAGAVGTAALLLRSRKHLIRLSPQVGRNIAFDGGVKAMGLLPDGFPDGDMYSGRSHPGTVSYEFMRSHGLMITAGKAQPLYIVSGARLYPPGQDGPSAHFGAAHVRLMQQLRRRAIVLVAFGPTPTTAHLELMDDGAVRGHLALDEELRGYLRRTRALLESILTRNGCRIVDMRSIDREGRPHKDLQLSTTHQVGSCRMADSPAQGVVDAQGQVFDYPGLYVSDGAAIPASPAVNPSLTILANAERVAESIVHSVTGRPLSARWSQRCSLTSTRSSPKGPTPRRSTSSSAS